MISLWYLRKIRRGINQVFHYEILINFSSVVRVDTYLPVLFAFVEQNVRLLIMRLFFKHSVELIHHEWTRLTNFALDN